MLNMSEPLEVCGSRASPECVVTCSSVSRGYKACSRGIDRGGSVRSCRGLGITGGEDGCRTGRKRERGRIKK